MDNPELVRLGELLVMAGKLDTEYRGMKVSVLGALSHGARALTEMASPPDTTDPALLEAHEERVEQAQPQLHGYMIAQLASHMLDLQNAIGQGDVAAVRRFFDTYKFA